MSIRHTYNAFVLYGACFLALAFVAGCGAKSDDKRPDKGSKSGDVSQTDDASAAASEADKERESPREHPAVLATLPFFSLTDQNGAPFGADELLGRAYVANFMFTRCKATCPVQTERLAELQQFLIDQKVNNDVRILSITVDPAHDTPPVLAEYALAHGADARLWKFLTGDRARIESLGKDGFRLPVIEGTATSDEAPLAHSAQFVLVDPSGRVRGYYESANKKDLSALRADLKAVMQERVLPTADLLQTAWLEPRRRAQIEAAGGYDVRRDFQFTDRVRESGITFRNRIVDASGRAMIAAHYDHGTGMAVADVDGDKRLDIYFVNQVGGNELWRNIGDGRFENITEKAGVALAQPIKASASFADTDNDGDADLFVTTIRGGNVLFVNDGSGVFRDITKDAGLDFSGHSSGAVFFDYNHDGLLDLFVTNVGVFTTEKTATVVNDAFTGPDMATYTYYTANPDAFFAHLKPGRADQSILYQNRGGNRFVDVTQAAELVDSSWSGDALAFDANDDGWEDLYIVNMQGHDEYFENEGGKRFVRKSRERFPATPWGTMGIEALDFENDGRFDLFLTDMHIDMQKDLAPNEEKMQIPKDAFDPSIMGTDRNHVLGNAFFSNRDGRFVESTQEVNAETYWPWGLSVGDLNADGYEDAFITAGMNFPWRYGINSLLLNERGERFRDAEFVLGVEPRRGGRTAIPWFELDANGADREHPFVKRLRTAGQTIPLVTVWGALGTRSSALFDIEGDGDLDIVTNDFHSEPMVLLSNLSEKGNLAWIGIDLVGAESNRDALGAVVAVQIGNRTLHQVHDGKSGYLSHSRMPLYFGLGSATQVDKIDIRWPSGKRQTVEGPIEINRQHEIREN